MQCSNAGSANQLASRRGARGFTLVEILAVLAITGLLSGMAIAFYGRQKDRAYATQTTATMGELTQLIAVYETRKGGPPPSSLATLKIRCDNDWNEGIEALYAALHHKDFAEGRNVTERWLGNVDEDETATSFHRDGVTRLLEVLDGWGNPIAYINPADFGKPMTYRMGEVFDPSAEEQVVTAQKSAVTGVTANADSYQLISAGEDRTFGTEDDVTNFKK